MKTRYLALSLLISMIILTITACSKSDSDTQHSSSVSDSFLSTDNYQPSTNLVFNGDFEQGIGTPEGWTTRNQILNDVTGWAKDETHNSTHSLKIENIGGTDAYWKGNKINIEKNINSIEFSIWSLTKSKACNFDIVLNLLTTDNKGHEDKESYQFSCRSGQGKWVRSSKKLLLTERITSISPIIFYKNVGEIYFEQLTINPLSYENSGNNYVYNGNLSSGKDNEISGWILRHNNKYNNITGWNKNDINSLILNNELNSKASWLGNPVKLDIASNNLYYSFKYKFISIKSPLKAALNIVLTFEDGTRIDEYIASPIIEKSSNMWNKVQAVKVYDKKVIKITPVLYIFEGKGTVEFTDIEVKDVVIK